MKNYKPLIVFILIFALIITSAVLISRVKTQKAIDRYTALLGDTRHYGLDSNETANHGTARYHYNLQLNDDGTCSMTFKFSKTDDKSTFSTNKKETFETENLTWVVEKDGGDYCVCIQGNMDWGEYSAAKLSRTFEIFEYQNDGEITLIATRSGYYDVYFRDVTG